MRKGSSSHTSPHMNEISLFQWKKKEQRVERSFSPILRFGTVWAYFATKGISPSIGTKEPLLFNFLFSLLFPRFPLLPVNLSSFCSAQRSTGFLEREKMAIISKDGFINQWIGESVNLFFSFLLSLSLCVRLSLSLSFLFLSFLICV